MAINRLLLTFTIVISSLVFSSGVSLALATTDGSSGSTFVWSQVSPIVGAKLKVSEVVSSSRKGTRAYRASGACSLRKGLLSFNRVGKCRVSVSVKMKNTGKVLRSSKVFMVSAKTLSVPQMQLTGTPQEQLMQVVAATAKVAAIPLTSSQWNQSLVRLNESLVSYGVTVRWDPNETGRNIYQISMDGQSVCFLWTYADNTSDNRSLQPHSCAKIENN